MSTYSDVKEIKVLDDPDAVNDLLSDWWELLEIAKNEHGLMFVLGRKFYNSMEELRCDYKGEGTD